MGAITSLFPLLILFSVVGIFAYIGFQIFLYTQTLAEHGKKRMEKGPISFSKDGGLKVNVKEVRQEDYADSTQSVLVNTWKLANESKAKSTSRSSYATGKPSTSRQNSGVSTGRA